MPALTPKVTSSPTASSMKTAASDLRWDNDMIAEDELDDFWLSSPSPDELEYAALGAEGPPPKPNRCAESEGTIERLGDMMAILGPRYKTLPRGMIWEKAVQGKTTPLQRQEKRLGALLGPDPRMRVSMRRAPEDLPNTDTEAIPRAAWLVNRKKERQRQRDRLEG